MYNKFKGLGVALVTPFNSNGEVDYRALRRILDYQLANGVDFLCVLGTTAETPCLTKQEKDNIKALVIEKVNGTIPILLGCGGNNTAAVINEIQTGDFSGIDGILSVCPYYNKPSQEGIYQHFKAIANSTNMPVVLYNVPGRVGVNMTAQTTLRLSRECENIVAVKEASGNFTQIDDIIKNKPKDFDVLSGDDGITFPLMTLGAKGVISVIGNALPKEFGKMVRLAARGEFETALQIHHRFAELFKLLFVDGNPAGVKAMLNNMGLLENELRLPLVPAKITTMSEIASIIKDLNIKC